MIYATIPVADMAAANATLEAAGFGPGNFSLAARTGSSEATHAGLSHAGNDPAFSAALKAIPNVTYSESGDFAAHAIAQGLEWQGQEDWIADLPQKGDTREQGGKTWESLSDNNVWPIPIGWREVGANPDWVQPVGALDAYPAGATVTHAGQVWTSDVDANVWEPGVYGWTENAAATDEWSAGVSYAVGDEVTYEGATYRCITGHTAITGWQPPAVPALWEAV